MSTPTPPLPESAPELPPRRGRSTLAKLAIAFAITMVITFGLCSAVLMNSTSAMSGPVFPTALVIEAICILGLVIIAILAIARRNRPN